MRIFKVVALFLSLSTALSAAEKTPQRIASGTVGTDEILFELLSQKGELKRLVAVSMFADDSRYSFLVPVPKDIRGRVGQSLEALLVLKPDLAILASYSKADLSSQLRAAGVKVVVQDNFSSVDAIESNIRSLASLIAAEKEGDALISRMEAAMKAAVLKQDACHPTLLQYSSNDTIPGDNTIFNNAVERAGFTNIATRMKLKGWAQISQEILVQLDPDFIVVSSAEAPDQAAFKKKILNQPGWKTIKAVKEARFIFVPDRLLYTVSHHISELVASLAKEHRCRKS